jgi:hypothetical protein
LISAAPLRVEKSGISHAQIRKEPFLKTRRIVCLIGTSFTGLWKIDFRGEALDFIEQNGYNR